MRAIVFRSYGPPEVLALAELPKPVPGPRELLVRVGAAEVTKTDCELRAFRFPVGWFWLPMRLFLGVFAPRKQVLGFYFAGKVETAGSDVTRFRVGDRVFGSSQMRLGAYGEYLCVPESYTLETMPTGMSFEQAATVPLGGLNAIHFMRLAAMRPGESLLIIGSGGSIGCYALQIAKMMGAHVTVVDAPHKQAGLLSLGADEFIDYTRSAFWELGKAYDVVLNMVAQTPFSRGARLLAPKGRYFLGNPKLSDMLRTLWFNLFSKKNLGRSASFAVAKESQEELSTLKEWLEEKKITPPVDQVFSWEDVQLAHERVEKEQRVGCVVLTHPARDAHSVEHTSSSTVDQDG